MTDTTAWFITRLHRTQKSSISSPRRTSRISGLLAGGRLPGGFGLALMLLHFRDDPLCRLEADILAHPQLAVLAFEQIADGERFARFAQALPRVVFVKSFHLA